MRTTLTLHLGVILQSLSPTPCQWKSPRSCLAACCLLRWRSCWSPVAPTRSFLLCCGFGRCLPAAGDWTVDPRLDWAAPCPPAALAHQAAAGWRAAQDSTDCDENGTAASWLWTWVECLKSLNQHTHTQDLKLCSFWVKLYLVKLYFMIRLHKMLQSICGTYICALMKRIKV